MTVFTLSGVPAFQGWKLNLSLNIYLSPLFVSPPIIAHGVGSGILQQEEEVGEINLFRNLVSHRVNDFQRSRSEGIIEESSTPVNSPPTAAV